MWDGFEELIDVASIAISASDVLGSPLDVGNFVRDIRTHDVILKDVLDGNVRIIDANKDNSGAVGIVDKNLVEHFRNRNFFIIDIKVDFLLDAISVIKREHSVRSCEHVQGDVTGCRQSSASIFNGSPVNSVFSLLLLLLSNEN